MSTPALHIRPAAARDLETVATIYNDGIRGRLATFETEERRAADLESWLSAPTHPFLVAETEQEETPSVVGWVRASTYRPRPCYAGVAEFSVYVADILRGRGIGDALMGAFLPACAGAGLWKVLSRIFPENRASRALCARHGFREVGVYQKHAQLDGVWRDVVIVERGLLEIGNGRAEPPMTMSGRRHRPSAEE
jgi:L-amino acid N-acyltransferase YncA